MILNPIFPEKEPFTHHQRNDILGRSFGVPYQITATLWHTHHVTASELLRMYSITLTHTNLHITLQYHKMDNILDDLLLSSLPWTMALQFQNQYSQTNAILDDITYSKFTQCDSVQCYFLRIPPVILNWSEVYNTNPDTSSILLHL